MTEKTQKTENSHIALPSELPELLLPWYDDNARPLPWRRDTDPYRVWVSEIMLQQTGAEVVRGYYTRFLDAFPTVNALASAEESRLLKLWEGLGYYARARNMLKAARQIVSRHGGRFPESFDDIRRLPGVGDYTAGAVASICFNQPEPAVDGNVARVAVRLAGIAEPLTEALKKRIAAALRGLYPAVRRGDFTQSLIELGAVVCLPRGTPKCHLCPAAGVCRAAKEGRATALPVKAAKPQKRLCELTVFLLISGGTVALRRREDGGLLGGLWELPNVPGHQDEAAAMETAASWGVRPARLLRGSRRSHVFTHIRWDMTVYAVSCREVSQGLTWVEKAALRDAIALPTAFRKLLDLLPPEAPA